MRGLLLLVFGLWAQTAMAQGFAVHDLTGLAEAARSALGPAATARAEAGQLGLHCAACAGAPAIELRIGRLTDGTEARVRSGRTTLAALEALCVRRNPDCRLSALPAGPAIGWLSVYALDGGAGATAVILRDGDLLTIEARASDRGAAEDAARRLMQAVLPRIVGPET
ncbi:hypothetical protein ASG32_14235 [Methylobacterium sp. Leaf361]|uniref:hypothetical protein n=1 Tax=Methylobacterium sp. Leaf361 TaxID=1736352 RepID=UPI0006F916F1|nr:hypothetical protein [Methylobacterium sp. Leaf361]KQS54977.1 hypothetical protein ASG32_14235 [Methylobacterium sp. Leaf361]